MPVRRVFIVWSSPLFHESVRLLLTHPEVELVGSNSASAEVQAEIETLRPDTIIIERPEEHVDVVEPLQILEASPWGPRIVSISLSNNELSVYRREQRTIGQADELLRLVLGL